jgi:hypothetical protein
MNTGLRDFTNMAWKLYVSGLRPPIISPNWIRRFSYNIRHRALPLFRIHDRLGFHIAYRTYGDE